MKGKKGGITIIELLIICVIIAIIAGVIVMAIGGEGGSRESEYNHGPHSEEYQETNPW